MRELNMESINYEISKHAQERYAERIMNKEDKGDINRFIINNEGKIEKDINKLIQYGELIYTGKQYTKNNKNGVTKVYVKDTWVVLVDNDKNKVITLYKIDLGLDDDFNKSYISKMIEKLNVQKQILTEVQEQTKEETSTYRQFIEDAEVQIKDYKTMIKNMEELCNGYRIIINNNNVRVTQAENDVRDVLNTLVGRKEF